MRIGVASIALLAASAWAAPAMAQSRCAQFQVIGTGARAQYNPFDSTDAQSNFDVRVEALTEGVNGVRFLLVDTTPGARGPQLGQAGPENYDVVWLEDTSRKVFVVGNELLNNTNGVQVRLPGRNGVEITRLRMVIPRGQAASAQPHREYLRLRYQCVDASGTPIGSQEEQAAPIEIEAQVPGYTAAYIGSVGMTRGAIEFGRIGPDSSNLTNSVSVTALSTVPYDVLIESDNRGMLRRAGTDTRGINYQMRYGGTQVVSGERLTCPATMAPVGRIEQFEVALDRASIGTVPAGDYSDVVTLTFRPRDIFEAGNCAASRAQ